MNRYYVIKDEVYHILNTECSKSNRQEAIEHLSNVANMAVFSQDGKTRFRISSYYWNSS